MKSTKSKTTDLSKFNTKVLNLNLSLGLSPFVNSAPEILQADINLTEKLCP